MRMRRTAALAAMLATVAPWAPARAATDPSVEPKLAFSYNKMEQGNWLVVVACRSLAQPASPTQVPLLTQVTCSVEDATGFTTSRTVLAAGAVAPSEVVVLAPPIGPVYACVSGKATLMDDKLYQVTNAGYCQWLPLTG